MGFHNVDPAMLRSFLCPTSVRKSLSLTDVALEEHRERMPRAADDVYKCQSVDVHIDPVLRRLRDTIRIGFSVTPVVRIGLFCGQERTMESNCDRSSTLDKRTCCSGSDATDVDASGSGPVEASVGYTKTVRRRCSRTSSAVRLREQPSDTKKQPFKRKEITEAGRDFGRIYEGGGPVPQ